MLAKLNYEKFAQVWCAATSETSIPKERRIRKTSLKQGSWSSKKEGVSEASACITGWRILYDWRQSTLDGTQRRRMRNVNVFAFKIINLAAFVKNIGRMHEAIEQSKRYRTSHIEHVCDITVWNYELWNISHSKIIIVFGFVITIHFAKPLDRAFVSLSNGMQHGDE